MKQLLANLITIFVITASTQLSNAQWNIGGNDLSADGTMGPNMPGEIWDLVFITQGNEKMRLSASGNLGIGNFSAADPAFKVDISNTTSLRSLNLANTFTSASTKYGIRNEVNNAGTGGRYGIYNSAVSNVESAATNYGIYNTVTHPGSGLAYGIFSTVATSGTGTHYGVYSSASGASNYSFYGIGRGYFSDKVGMGITAPEGQLHIKNLEVDLTSGGSLILGATNDVNMAFDNNEIHVRNNGEATMLYLNPLGGNVSINNGAIVNDASLTSEGAFRIGDNAASNLIMDNNEIQARNDGGSASLGLNVEGGNVYIGTWSGTEKLNVCGGIKATEIRVETGWCDYVFANDYKLRPLKEVSAFIEANNHLPNIPPASEVESEGLAVGNMAMRMMEKIEELTLYLIQQDKQLQALTEENKKMQDQLQSLINR